MYDSISNLPIYLFNKINITGDVKLLKRSLKYVSDKKLEQTWIKIYNEFIKEIGVSDKFKEWITKQKEIVNHYCKAYVDGERHHLNFARIKEAEVNKLMEGENTDFNDTVAIVTKFMGVRINPIETTVLEFYSYLKLMEKSGRITQDNKTT
jgi:1,2-phenylacetyl-CoA epoxidase catalytic subunit